MTEIEVQVLGPLRVLLDQRVARIKGGHQRTLLGRLVTARGAVVGTDRLIEDVWEGRPPPQAASVLQVQVHNLRRLLEPARLPRVPSAVLVSESGGYALVLGDDGVDAWSFEKAMQRYERLMREQGGRIPAAERHRLLDDALGRWHGAAFESFASASWVSAEVSHLTELHATAVELRAEAAYELGRDLDVIATLPHQLLDNPGREESARLLALAQYRLGRQVDALATLRRTRDHLRTEFGIDPGRRLAEAEQAILAGTVDPAVTGGVAVTVRRPGTDPDPPGALHPSVYPAQVAALRLAAETARSNGPRTVWVAGESGSGKTVLAKGIRSELAALGWTTAYASCPEVDGAPPAWPIRELLAELDAVAPTEEGDHFAVLRRVSERCGQLLANTPVAIFLDGAHHADLPTLQGLRQLSVWLSHKPILIVVTVRGSEAIAGMPGGVRGSDSMSERVELTGVDIAGTREIARACGRLDPSESTVRALHERTAGNPLFIRMWVESGVEYPLPAEPPAGIVGVLLERAERLPPGGGDVLRHMAVWNSPIDVDTLSILSGIAAVGLVDLADRALAAGLIRSDGEGTIVLADDLLRRELYRDIAPIRRTRMHWQIVEYVGSRIGTAMSDGAELVALTGHALRGSTPTTAVKAIEYLIAAADRCAEQRLPAEASRLRRAALPLCERASLGMSGHGDDERRRLFRMLCRLAEGLAHDGQHEDAAALRERVVGLAGPDPSDALARALICNHAPVLWRTTPPVGNNYLAGVLRRALTAPASEHRRAMLLVTLVLDIEGHSPVPQRFAGACEALALAYSSGDHAVICAALEAVASALAGSSWMYLWETLAREMHRMAVAAGSARYEALAHHLRFRTACGRGDLSAACGHATEALRCGAHDPALDLRITSLYFVAALRTLAGDQDAAAALYRGAIVTCAEAVGDVSRTVSALAIQAELALAWSRGSLAGLRRRLGHSYESDPVHFAQAFALALVHAGELGQARAVLRAHRVLPTGTWWQTMAACRGRAAVELGETEMAAEVLEQLERWSGGVIGLDTGVAAFEPVDAVLAELAEATGDPEAALRYRERAAESRDRLRDAVATVETELAVIASLCGVRTERDVEPM